MFFFWIEGSVFFPRGKWLSSHFTIIFTHSLLCKFVSPVGDPYFTCLLSSFICSDLIDIYNNIDAHNLMLFSKELVNCAIRLLKTFRLALWTT